MVDQPRVKNGSVVCDKSNGVVHMEAYKSVCAGLKCTESLKRGTSRGTQIGVDNSVWHVTNPNLMRLHPVLPLPPG
jgi:hypothetical protein